MSKLKFEEAIKEFFELDYPQELEVLRIDFTIRLMKGEGGSGISFGGEYILETGESLPIDLRKIGKSRCRELVDVIHVFFTECVLNITEFCNIIEIHIQPKESDELVYFYRWDPTID